MNTIKINKKTKLSELIKTYPQLRSRLSEVNPKFKMLSSPMGNIMIPKTTVADMIERSGMSEEDLIKGITELISDIESSSKINNEPEWLSQISSFKEMDGLGFERLTKQLSENEWHVYFYRTKIDEKGMDIPFRPAALLNFPMIDEELGNVAVNFWDLTWNNKKRYLPNLVNLIQM